MSAAGAVRSAPSLVWLREMPVMAQAIDGEGRLLEVSDVWLSTLQLRREQVLGRCFVEFLTGVSRAIAERQVPAELFGDGAGREVERQMLRADGQTLDVLMSAQVLPGRDGSGGCALVVFTDLTALKAAERRVAASEARFRRLADAGAEMTILLDKSLVRRYVSPACEQMFGLAPAQMIGEPGEAHPEDMPCLREAFGSLLSGETEIQTVVARLPDRDGHWIQVEAKYRALRDARSGEVTGIFGSLREPAASKAVESERADVAA